MEMIMLEEVVHLPGGFNLISQSQIMDQDVKVERVNHYSLNLYNRHGKWIATAPQVDGRFGQDRALEWTEYPDINQSCLLALMTTAHASQPNAEKQMLWHRRLAHIGLQALEILLMVVADTPKMTGKCDCKSSIKCKSGRKPFTPNTTSCTTEPLQLMHSDICGALEIPIEGG
jgi:hypothetical protein